MTAGIPQQRVRATSVLVALFALLLSPSASAAPSTLPAQTTAAAPANALTVLPPTLTIEGARGSTIERVVSVENPTAQPQVVRVDVRNFVPSDENGGAAPTDEDSPFSMVRWVSVDSRTLMLAPGVRVGVSVTIAVPADAEAGSRFASIVFVPQAVDTGNGFQTATEVASLVLLRVPGPTKQHASIASFTAEHQDGGYALQTRVLNDGAVHIVPTGKVEITNLFGRTVATYGFNTDDRPVLPTATRRFLSTWDPRWLAGWYRAKVTVTYPSNDADQAPVTLTASRMIFAVSPAVVGIGVVLVLLAVLVVRRHRRRARHRRSLLRRRSKRTERP